MRFAMNETARLYRRVGRRGGAPEYDAGGVEFPCRTEGVAASKKGGRGFGRADQARVFTEDMAVGAGDRLVLADGTAMIVVEVRAMRGLRGVHHLEIVAEAEA